MGFRDLHASLAQFNLEPVDPEQETQTRIDRFISESIRMSGLDEEGLSFSLSEPTEEWTVVYDKFQMHRR